MNLSLPKEANSEVLLQTDNDAEIISCKKIIRTLNCLLGSYYSDLVPVAGLEPARYRYQRILSPSRLPISPHRHTYLNILAQNFGFGNN